MNINPNIQKLAGVDNFSNITTKQVGDLTEISVVASINGIDHTIRLLRAGNLNQADATSAMHREIEKILLVTTRFMRSDTGSLSFNVDNLKNIESFKVDSRLSKMKEFNPNFSKQKETVEEKLKLASDLRKEKIENRLDRINRSAKIWNLMSKKAFEPPQPQTPAPAKAPAQPQTAAPAQTPASAQATAPAQIPASEKPQAPVQVPASPQPSGAAIIHPQQTTALPSVSRAPSPTPEPSAGTVIIEPASVAVQQELERDISTLNQHLDSAVSEIEGLVNVVKQKEDEIYDQREQLETLDANNRKLKTENKTLYSALFAAEEKLKLTSNQSPAEEALSAAQTENDELQKQLEAQRKKIEKLSSEIDEANSKVSTLTGANIDLQNRLLETTEIMSIGQIDALRHLTELEKSKDEHRTLLEKYELLNNENATLKADQQSVSNTDELEMMQELHREEVAKLQTQIKDKLEELDSSYRKLEDSQQAHNIEKEELSKKLKDAQDEIAKLEYDIEIAKRPSLGQTVPIEKYQDIEFERDIARNAVGELQKKHREELQNLRSVINKQDSELETLRMNKEIDEEQQSRIDDLQRNLRVLTAQNQKLEEQVAHLTEDRDAWEHEFRTTHTEKIRLQDVDRALREEQNKLEEKENLLDAMKTERDELLEEIEAFEERNKQLTEAIETTQDFFTNHEEASQQFTQFLQNKAGQTKQPEE